MSRPSETATAADVAPGTFVAAMLDGRRTLCLKVDRVGKDHVNHFLVPLDPVEDRRALALVYTDPDTAVTVVEGVSFSFADAAESRNAKIAEDSPPEVGDAFSSPLGVYLKVIDRPQSQRMHAYVDIATGLLRPRMDRHVGRLLAWSIQRL